MPALSAAITPVPIANDETKKSLIAGVRERKAGQDRLSTYADGADTASPAPNPRAAAETDALY